MTTALTKAVSIKVPTLHLTQLISKVVRQLPKQTTNELYKGILIEFAQDRITASIYNGVMAMRVSKELEVPLQLAHPISAVLIHPRIGTVFNQLSGAFTTVKYDAAKQVMNLTSNKSKYKLSAFDSSDFPDVEDIMSKVPLTGTLTAEFLKTAYGQVPKFAAKSEARPTLQAVNHIISPEGSILLVSTDSFTLRSKRIPFLSEIEVQKEAAVPANVITEMANLLQKVDEEKVYLHTNDKAVLYRWEDQEKFLSFQLYSALKDGNFPDTSRLTERADESPRVRFVRSEFEQAVKRVVVSLSGQDHQMMHFAVKGRQARVFTRGQFPATEDFNTESAYNDEIVITFNPQFILKALQSFNDDEILLTITNNLRPMFMEDVEQQNGLALILPVRTNESITVDWPEVTEPLDFNAPAETPAAAETVQMKEEVECFVETVDGEYHVTYRAVDTEEEPWGGYNIEATQEALDQLNESIALSENVIIKDTHHE